MSSTRSSVSYFLVLLTSSKSLGENGFDEKIHQKLKQEEDTAQWTRIVNNYILDIVKKQQEKKSRIPKISVQGKRGSGKSLLVSALCVRPNITPSKDNGTCTVVPIIFSPNEEDEKFKVETRYMSLEKLKKDMDDLIDKIKKKEPSPQKKRRTGNLNKFQQLENLFNSILEYENGNNFNIRNDLKNIEKSQFNSKILEKLNAGIEKHEFSSEKQVGDYINSNFSFSNLKNIWHIVDSVLVSVPRLSFCIYDNPDIEFKRENDQKFDLVVNVIEFNHFCTNDTFKLICESNLKDSVFVVTHIDQSDTFCDTEKHMIDHAYYKTMKQELMNHFLKIFEEWCKNTRRKTTLIKNNLESSIFFVNTLKYIEIIQGKQSNNNWTIWNTGFIDLMNRINKTTFDVIQ